MVDAAGGTPQLLVAARWERSLRRAAYPTFSPDGSQIAFVAGFGGSGTIFMVMNADGSDPRVMLHDETFQGAGHIYSLVWSPDGTRLAFDSDANFGIYTFEADGSGLMLVIPRGSDPYWSPDGSRISYDLNHPGTARIADADGTHDQGFGGARARSGPWNPLSDASSDIAPTASGGLTLSSTLLLAVVLLALVAGTVLIRRRIVHRS